MKSMLSILFCLIVYNADAQIVAIERDRTYKAYAGMENPLTIAVEGYASSTLTVTTDNGKLTGGNGHYILTPTTEKSTVTVTVSVKKDKLIKELRKIEMTIECIKPDGAYFMSGEGGVISLADVHNGSTLRTYIKGFDFQPPFFVTSCTVIVERDRKQLFNKTIADSISVSFAQDGEVKRMMQGVLPGDQLKFTNIKYKGTGGCIGTLAPMHFIVN